MYKRQDTEEVFGNYIDVYDMSQAVDDGATDVYKRQITRSASI